uniref:Uncharacterized protein n=1 Tax=Anguilla anguilla TaxID=7936 RepID=A0A0E9SAQ2_ANGAN
MSHSGELSQAVTTQTQDRIGKLLHLLGVRQQNGLGFFPACYK